MGPRPTGVLCGSEKREHSLLCVKSQAGLTSRIPHEGVQGTRAETKAKGAGLLPDAPVGRTAHFRAHAVGKRLRC